MEIIICSKCNIEKSVNDFHKNKKGKFGIKSHCKTCCALIASKESKKNRRKSCSEYRKNNKSKVNTYNRKWRRNNPEKIQSYNKKWKQSNPDAIAKLNRNRKKHIKIATIGDYDKKINAIYAKANKLEKQDGVKRHVHHIIPLCDHKIFCGLHVPWNLQILTIEEHLKKHKELRKIYEDND